MDAGIKVPSAETTELSMFDGLNRRPIEYA